MSPFSFFRLLAALSVLLPLFVGAQDLADVLSSIQERKRAVEQGGQVSAHLPSLFAGDPAVTIPDQVLIEWDGLNGVNFPSAGSLSSLSIEARVSLLNQAILEFRKLYRNFMNLRPEDLAQDAKVGAFRPYLREDFRELGRADASNYHPLLFELANNVLRLRVRDWPFAGKKLKKTYEIHKWERPEEDESGHVTPVEEYEEGSLTCSGWAPTSFGEGSVDSGEEGSWESGLNYPYAALTEDVDVRSSFYSVLHPDDLEPENSYSLRTLDVSKAVNYYSEAALFASVPGRTGDQIGGKVVLLVKNSWSPAAAADVTAPASWNHADAAYLVVEVETDATAATSLGNGPAITVNVEWFEFPDSVPENLSKTALPAGFADLKAGYKGNRIAGSWQNNLEIPSNGARVLERQLHALCVPDFKLGLNSGSKAGFLEKSAMAARPSSGDAAPRLHPVPGLLAGVPLGVGISGNSFGWIGVSPGNFMFHGVDDEDGNSYLASGIICPATIHYIPRVIRYDHAANLRFVGTSEDFHVVYATERAHAKRGAGLPDFAPTFMEDVNSGWDGQFFTAWDMPRLRQVVSRDFIVDVMPQGHFKNEVKIFRRPQPADEVDRTPGHLEAPDEDLLLRTLVFSNPDATTGAYPAVAEKVRIADITTFYEVWRDGLDTWGLTSPLHFKTSNGSKEYFSKDIEFPEGLAARITTKVDGTTLSVDEVNDPEWSVEAWHWWDDQSPASVVRSAAGETITITNTLTAKLDDSTAGSQEGRYPDATTTEYSYQPDLIVEWRESGVIDSVSQEPWFLDVEPAGNGLKAFRKLNSSLVNTVTTEWDGLKVKTTTTADGSASPETAWTEMEYGNTGGTGLPGRPHRVKNSDGTGATYEWGWIAPSNSDQLTLTQGLLTSGTVSRGTRSLQRVNARGHFTSFASFLIHGGTLQTGGSILADFTDWGMPQNLTDHNTSRDSSWTYDGKLSRLASATWALGVSSTLTGYDAMDRPGSVTTNGISSANKYTAFSTTATISGGASGSITDTRDALGRLTNGSTTWNGVTDTAVSDRSTPGILKITGNHSLFGEHRDDFREDDGSVSLATGDARPFGGVDGTTNIVDGGLLKTTVRLLNPSGSSTDTFTTTWTDAWGRVRKVSTPPASGSSPVETGIAHEPLDHNGSNSKPQRAIVTDKTGRVTITETDPVSSSGILSRSGIDVNGNRSLGAGDRYVEILTTVSGSNVVTTLSLTEDSGLREILRTTWTPSGNKTVTKINGNEETITRTPNYGAKTIKIESTKGWEKNESFNNLGLTTSSALSGTGIPAAALTPTWRDDGSLSELTFTTGGDTHSATFNNNGTLATLNAPGKGNILGGHSISGGVETLTVDEVTTKRALDGTFMESGGGDVIGRTEQLAISGGGFKHTTTPAVGSATETTLNAAGAPIGKNYAAGVGEIRKFLPGGLLEEVTLARGGEIEFGYSNDGAKDLTSATWPTVSSGGFTHPAATQRYRYDRAGRMKEISDSSGVRAIAYQNGRLKQTVWNSGALAGYKVVKSFASSGFDGGFTLYRGGTAIHAVGKTPNGTSGEVSHVTASGFNAAIGRDGARRVESITRDSVVQRWQRGTAGRITAADTNNTVSGAPSFSYTRFDAKGRRLNAITAGGEWIYQYPGGQLTSAVHSTLGRFSYGFDAIGRRTDKGGSNATDVLNRTMGWTNSAAKFVEITAHPAARLWVDGTEITGFAGNYSYALPAPGPSAVWVPWNALAVLEGQGDPGANVDAKAERSGFAWIPPATESFGYDEAGNRQSTTLWDYGWDAKNQLVRVRTKNYSLSTTPQGYDVSSSYDAEGRRFRKTVTRYQSGAEVEQKTTTFLWDGNDLIYEREQLPSGLTTLERKYVWGPDIAGGSAGGAGGLLLIRETLGNTTTDLYPLYDGTGHVTALADSRGTLQAAYAYGPFGELIHATGPHAQSNPFRYATKYYDMETGLYDFGRRYFDPVTGQWLSREPLGEGESLNLYSYCHNDPINKVDRLGLDEVIVTDGKAQYNFVDEVNGARGGWLKKALDHLFLAKLDGSARNFTGRVSLGAVSGGMVSLPCGASVPLSDLQTIADGRSMGSLDEAIRMRLLTGDINDWLSRNEGAGGSKLVGTLDKIISSPFQAMAGPDALTLLTGIADKHDGFSFGVDLASRNYVRGIHLGTEIDDGIQVAGMVMILNPKNAGTLIRGARSIEGGAAFGSEVDYMVSFMGKNGIRYYDNTAATLGAPGGLVWMAPLEDIAGVSSRAGVVTASGHAPGPLMSYMKGESIFGIVVPRDALSFRSPTALDAGANRHFRPGGFTGVEHNGVWRSSNVTELVTSGGDPVPSGSTLFRFNVDGSWTPIRRY